MADPNRGLIQSHLQTTEGYGDAQSTYIPSATNRDMHAASAAEGSPTGVLEGANQNQVTKRAMAMRLIYNAREKKKEPPWGVKSAYGRVTPPVGSFNPINRNISRFRKC